MEKMRGARINTADMERGRTRPSPQKGNIWDPANYRPISLLLHIGNIIESAIYKKLRSVYRFKIYSWGSSPGGAQN